MGKYLDYYCGDENKILKWIVDSNLQKFGGINLCDHDDFYSLAAEVCWKCEEEYDPDKGVPFEPFFRGRLSNKIKTMITARNRDKRTMKIEVIDEDTGKIRKIPIPDVRIDAPIGEDDGVTIADTIPSKFDTNNYMEENCFDERNEKVEKYLSSLPELPKKIATLIMAGYNKDDIKSKLRLSDKQFQNSWEILNSYERKRILFENNNYMEEKKMSTPILTEDVAERYKNTSYSIESICKQLQKKRIRDDHVLQRYSGMWQRFAKSELVSDILRGKSLTQIIISEEIKNGLRMQWLIDGKQRCTTLDEYLHDMFPISKNIKNYNIRYQTPKIDEHGKEVLNEDGFTEMEYRNFDIRGKKFSQLPEELQDIFRDRQIPVLYNTNCTKKDIADDIARFNRSRPMNKAQNGWLGLDESFAELVDNISKMQFFQQDFVGTAYTNNNFNSGMIRRIIVESIIVSDFIDEFCDFDKMCEFLSEEASDSNFTEFYSLVERLMPVCNSETAKVFDVKDSFLWFGLFSRFSDTGLDDNKFIEFVTAFNHGLNTKKINGVYFNELCVNPETGRSRSTKDKSIVIEKMNHLESLMREFLHIEEEPDDSVVIEPEEFIVENVGVDADTLHDDIEFYEQDTKDLLDKHVKDGSKLKDETNRLSLLALMVYAYKIDEDLDEWLERYAAENNMYFPDQKRNFLHMKHDFDEFVAARQRISA